MLKRFMNWLLHQLQKVLGRTSRRRGNGSSSQKPGENKQRLADRAASVVDREKAVPGSEASSSEPFSPGPTAAEAFSSPPPLDELSNAAIEQMEPMPESEVSDTSEGFSIPANLRTDTHRRLDATSAVESGKESLASSFPNEVSQLLSEPTARVPQSEDSDQLPEIHDLLPAIEPEPPLEEAASEDSVVESGNSRVTNAAVANPANADLSVSEWTGSGMEAPQELPRELLGSAPVDESEPDIATRIPASPVSGPVPVSDVPASGIEIEPDPVVVEPASRELPTVLSSSSPMADPPTEQAVLFSFDIIESDEISPDDSLANQTLAKEILTEEAQPEEILTKEESEENQTDVLQGADGPQPESVDTEGVDPEEANTSVVGSQQPPIQSDGRETTPAERSVTGLAETVEMTADSVSAIELVDALEDAPVAELSDAFENEPESGMLPEDVLFADTPEFTPSESTSSETNTLATDPPESSVVDRVNQLPYPWGLSNTETVPRENQTPVADPVSTADNSQQELPNTVPAVEIPTVERPDVEGATGDEIPVKQGVVKLLFTLKKGNFHGYIEPDDGTKDILFHQKYINSEIFDRLERGVKVVASVKYIEGKVYATHVDLL